MFSKPQIKRWGSTYIAKTMPLMYCASKVTSNIQLAQTTYLILLAPGPPNGGLRISMSFLFAVNWINQPNLQNSQNKVSWSKLQKPNIKQTSASQLAAKLSPIDFIIDTKRCDNRNIILDRYPRSYCIFGSLPSLRPLWCLWYVWYSPSLSLPPARSHRRS
jgi:hypothetical protein